jgi:hypothetical protein
MGKIGKALLGGLGAGLTSLGQTMALENQQEREDARLKTLDEFKERELSAREAESKLNQQRMEIANKQQQSLFNLKRYTQIMATSKMDPEQMARANTDLINNGMVYKNNSIEASKFQEKKNATGAVEFAKPYVVWDVGTYNTDENDEPITGADGKPEYIPHQTGNGKMIFWDRDEFVNYITKSANADEFSKYNFIKVTAADQRNIDSANIASKAAAKSQTKTGTLKDVKLQAEIDKLDREKKVGPKGTPSQQPVTSIKKLDGTQRKLTTAESQSMKALAERLSKKFPSSLIDEEVAGKVMEVRNDSDIRTEFAKFAIQAVKGTGKITPNDFRKKVRELGMPVEFADKLLVEAEDLSEVELAKKGIWDSILGIF